jgi:hypothetical protein
LPPDDPIFHRGIISVFGSGRVVPPPVEREAAPEDTDTDDDEDES